MTLHCKTVHTSKKKLVKINFYEITPKHQNYIKTTSNCIKLHWITASFIKEQKNIQELDNILKYIIYINILFYFIKKKMYINGGTKD